MNILDRPAIDANEMWTTHRIGNLLQVDPTSIARWAKERGLVCSFTPGGHRRIRIGDLHNFLQKYNMAQPFVLKDE